MTIYSLEHKFDFERAVEDGNLFTASHLFPAVAASGVVYAHMTPTTRRVAVKVQITANSHTVIKSYSGTTYTDIGSPVLIAPRNIGTQYTPVTIVRHTPVIDTLGTLRIIQNMAGGDKNVTATGSSWIETVNLIIPPNVDVLLEITNHGQEITDIGVLANFIEEIS